MNPRNLVLLTEYFPKDRADGISIRTVRKLIFNARSSGIVESGAVVRFAGRWYVNPERFEQYISRETAAWLERQPLPLEVRI